VRDQSVAIAGRDGLDNSGCPGNESETATQEGFDFRHVTSYFPVWNAIARQTAVPGSLQRAIPFDKVLAMFDAIHTYNYFVWLRTAD
jgi:hypothetical protein